ncbi:MAG: hypothetical protein Q8M19_15285 [Reyranella sp.]|nr:hypothetical protein [Reyranella sp.]MDP2332049.1 hypothetical protein [Reyranella sp.]
MAVAHPVATIDHVTMLANLALAALMVSVHLGGLLCLLWMLRARVHRFRPHESRPAQIGVILFVVLGLDAAALRSAWI